MSLHSLLTRLVPRHRAVAALWSALALIVAGLVVSTFTDPPDRVVAEEIDGRTWLPVARGDGAALVLANGISGLVEAEADTDAVLPTGLTFGGSNSRFTLLGVDGTSVLVADGSHVAAAVDTGRGASNVLAGAGLLTAGDDVTVRSIGQAGEIGDAVAVAGAGTPTPGAAPIVDAAGDAWVLTGAPADTAVRIDGTGQIADRIDVGASASQLLTVDGRPYVRRTDGLESLDGGPPLPGAGDRGLVPSVAEAVEGRWAVASGRSITIDSGTIVTAPGDVRSLAIWHGQVWTATDDGAFVVRDGATTAVGDDVSGPFETFVDGGRLWFVSTDGAIAIDRNQQPTVFRLAAVDLSLCIGDCSPEAAVDFLDEITPTTPPEPGETTPTTAPPPDITLPPVLPTTLPTTLPATTTTPEPPATTITTPQVVATTAGPTTTIPAPTVPADTVPVETMPVDLPPPPTDPEPAPPPPPTRPTTPPPPPPPTPTTAPPAPGGGVILAFADGDPITGSTATVQIGFDGSANECRANGGGVLGGSTISELSWSGAGGGSRSVAVRTGGAASETFDVQPGTLSVSFSVCGLSASISRTVRGEPPAVGDIAIGGDTVEGGTLTASVGYSYSAGWSVGNASWRAGPCGAESSLGSGSTGPDSSSSSFTASSVGRYCVAVVVSFVAEGGGSVEESRSGGVEIAPGSTTTTDPSATTTTTVPGSTAPTTTAPPDTTPPTTAPPTTVPPTTAPPTTAEPTTTTTTPPTTTTVVG